MFSLLKTLTDLQLPGSAILLTMPDLRAHCRLFLMAAIVVCHGVPANAESLRCNGNITSEGDSRMSVLYKCGQPVLADSFCVPVYYAPALIPVPQPFASVAIPCQQVEEWLYDRGEGNLMATVRFRSGVVQSISYGRGPR